MIDLDGSYCVEGKYPMERKSLAAAVEKFLFGNGQQLNDYFIEQTPVSEMLCYRNSEGREFDLALNDADLSAAAISTLKMLGVEVRRLMS